MKEQFYEFSKKYDEHYKLLFLKFKMLEMKYPYINLNLCPAEPKRGLLKVQLLEINDKNEYRINYKEFFKYLELKEKIEVIPLINDKKYPIIPCNNKVPYVKIKHKNKRKII